MIKPLVSPTHKSSSYVAGFFNGDFKLFNAKTNEEELSLSGLIAGESEISDALWFSSDKLASNFLVACSPCESNPQVCILKQNGKNMNVIGRAN